MPDIPTVQLRQQAPRQRLPDVGPGAGAYAGRGLSELAEVGARLSDASDRTEAARIVSQSRAQFSAAVDEETLTKPDYKEFNESATTRLNELHAEALNTDNRRVKTLVQNALQDDLIRGQVKIRQETFKKQKDKVGTDYLITMDQLSKSSVGADEDTQNRNGTEFSVLQAQLMADGFLTKEQAFKDRKKFRDDILEHTANRMIDEGQSDQVLRDSSAGRFDSMDPEARRRVTNGARTQMERDERSNDRAASEIKKAILNGWQGEANNGRLQSNHGAELQRALDGKNPYVSAKEARELLNVDNNPSTGGNDSVKALASEYYLSPRTLPHINATRAKLRAMQAQIGRQDPLISKLANELQSDQTTMENQGISRESVEVQRTNQRARDAVTEYDATKPVLPFNMPFLQNLDKRNRALIEDAIKKGKDPKAVIQQKTDDAQKRIDAIPDRNKKVLGLK